MPKKADQIEIGSTAVAEVPKSQEVQHYSTEAAALPDVGRLMEMALAQGESGVAALERLVAMQERILTIQAERALTLALAAFHAECPPIPKTAAVDYVTKNGARIKYNFAPLDTIAEHIRPFLAPVGLSYSWDEEDLGEKVKYTCILHHADGASRRASTTLPAGSGANDRMNPAQRVKATQTYGHRASLTQVLGLTATEDDVDGQEPGGDSDPTTISEAQRATLAEWFDTLGDKLDRKAFFAYFKCDTLAEMTVGRYEEAVAMLKRKAAK